MIKQTMIETPEPFKGYQEFSNFTQHIKKHKKLPQRESEASMLKPETSMVMDSSVSVDLNELLLFND